MIESGEGWSFYLRAQARVAVFLHVLGLCADARICTLLVAADSTEDIRYQTAESKQRTVDRVTRTPGAADEPGKASLSSLR